MFGPMVSGNSKPNVGVATSAPAAPSKMDQSKATISRRLNRNSQSEEPEPRPEESQSAVISALDIKSLPLEGMIPGYDESVPQTNTSCKAAALCAAAAWVFLVLLVMRFAPVESFEVIGGVERNAAFVTFLLLFVSNLGRILPLVYRRRKSAFSGVIVGAITVQGIAMTTDAIMALFPTPVVTDPVTGGRVHLLRWCEWAPVGFLMTFLTEAVDVPDASVAFLGLAPGTLHALCQGVSTLMGLLFPFAPNFTVWCVMMTVSCALYSVIFVRLRAKCAAFAKMQRGTSAEEMEIYERARLSLRLLGTCVVVWSILVFLFFFSWVAPLYAREGSPLHSPALGMLTECTCEVMSKILYLLIIVDVHNIVFDDGAQAERRLAELRHMMGIVWESSSDVIAISVRGRLSGNIKTMISPTYHKLEGGLGVSDAGVEGKALSEVVLEMGVSGVSDHKASLKAKDESCGHDKDISFSPKRGTKSIARMPTPTCKTCLHRIQLTESLSKISRRDSSCPTTLKKAATSNLSTRYPGIKSMGDLVAKAWQTTEHETLLMHDLVNERGGDEKKVRCEAMVTRLEKNALVVVVRDISERFRRFEAEKRVVVESTKRQKDAEANRFTRHEVKNGLLAAIGLCDSVREAFEGCAAAPVVVQTNDVDVGVSNQYKCDKDMMIGGKRDAMMPSTGQLTSIAAILSGKDTSVQGNVVAFDVSRCMSELDSTLREVLDTILAEAMARDVIHEVYVPKLERVDICSVLHGVRGLSVRKERFPLNTFPNPLPQVMFDPQLLRYIHRNAVSNACKYGKKRGRVVTEVLYNASTSELKMDVINLPGPHHEDLLQLGSEAEAAVFAPGKRLHLSFDSGSSSSQGTPSFSSRLHSSGDGAWIIQKLAKTLGGTCSMKFEKERTVFSMRCKATPVDVCFKKDPRSDPTRFTLPPNTWGIAIDDSKIQRKLMDRFLSLLGVEPSRRIIVGKDADEIEGFNDLVVQTIRDYPDNYFLLLADENLDITHHHTVSGSLCVQQIRKQLKPEEEQRMLALVRSANDSSEDVALYYSRAHGFLPKAPIQRDRVLEIIAPLWYKRFPMAKTCLQEIPSGDCDESAIISRSDIVQSLEVIDALCTQGDPSSLSERWPVIWEKLHRLKGDLMTMYDDSTRVAAVLETINHLRATELPSGFIESWNLIKSLIVSIM